MVVICHFIQTKIKSPKRRRFRPSFLLSSRWFIATSRPTRAFQAACHPAGSRGEGAASFGFGKETTGLSRHRLNINIFVYHYLSIYIYILFVCDFFILYI